MSMRQQYRYRALLVAGVALLMTACEVAFDGDIFDPVPPDGDKIDDGIGVKPTVPLKRRPIVPKDKLKRPNIIERVNWTAAGTLSVTIAEDAPAVVTIIERDGTTHGYMLDAHGVEIIDVPEETFELQIDVAEERYTVVVE